MKITIVAGSNGQTLELAKKFQTYFNSVQVQSVIIDLVELDLPLYTSKSDSLHNIENLVRPFKEHLLTDGFLFIAPEYNGGLPPAFTNFIAWISRSTKDWRESFNGKAAAIGTFSGGPGFSVLSMMRTQLAYIGLNVIGRQLSASSGKPVDENSLKAVADQLIKLSK